jgi:hypothetical protein
LDPFYLRPAFRARLAHSSAVQYPAVTAGAIVKISFGVSAAQSRGVLEGYRDGFIERSSFLFSDINDSPSWMYPGTKEDIL